MLFRAAATAETKRQDWLCMRVQPTAPEICGSGLLESKGRISFHSHRLNLWFARCTSRKIVLIELFMRHSVGNLNPILCPAYGEERSHLQKGIQRDKVVWRRSGKSLRFSYVIHLRSRAQDVWYFNIANLKYTLFATIKYKCILSISKIRKVRDKISLSSDFDYLPSHACRTLYCGSKV